MDCDLHAGEEKMEKNKHKLEIEFLSFGFVHVHNFHNIGCSPLEKAQGIQISGSNNPSNVLCP